MAADIEFPVNGDIPQAIPDSEHYEMTFDRPEQSSYRGAIKSICGSKWLYLEDM